MKSLPPSSILHQETLEASATMIPYGRSRGRVLSAREASGRRPIKCVCPACGGALVVTASDRNIKQPHFVHACGSVCHAGFELAVGLRAVQVLLEHRTLRLPAWEGSEEMRNPPVVADRNGNPVYGQRVEYRASDVYLSSAAAALCTNEGVPCIVARDGRGEIWIEVRVRPDGGNLTQPVHTSGQRHVLIDLSGMTAEQVLDEKKFARCVLKVASNRRWVSCSDAAAMWLASRACLNDKLDERNRKIEERDRLAAERVRRQEERKEAGEVQKERFRLQLRKPHEEALRILPSLVEPARVNELMEAFFENASMEISECMAQIRSSDVRSVMLEHHADAWIYGVHPVLWQLHLFLHFIHGQPSGAVFDEVDVGRWVLTQFSKDPVLHQLFMAQYRGRADARLAGFRKHSLSYWVFTEEENDEIPDFYAPVNDVVDRLVGLKVLHRSDEIRGVLVVAGEAVHNVLDEFGEFACSPRASRR